MSDRANRIFDVEMDDQLANRVYRDVSFLKCLQTCVGASIERDGQVPVESVWLTCLLCLCPACIQNTAEADGTAVVAVPSGQVVCRWASKKKEKNREKSSWNKTTNSVEENKKSKKIELMKKKRGERRAGAAPRCVTATTAIPTITTSTTTTVPGRCDSKV